MSDLVSVTDPTPCSGCQSIRQSDTNPTGSGSTKLAAAETSYYEELYSSALLIAIANPFFLSVYHVRYQLRKQKHCFSLSNCLNSMALSQNV